MAFEDTRFIVLEGLDGAGTTTQAARLQARITLDGAPCFLTNEPTSEPIGTFIRRLLVEQERGRDGGPYRPGEQAMGLLFAADRLAHSRVIAQRLSRGERVVCDRYLLSSMAYQTLDPDITGAWVVEVNRGCAVPDVTLLVSVPVDQCLARIAARQERRSRYETRAHLEKIARNYERVVPLYEQHFGRVVRIDGTRSIDEVHEAVVEGLKH